MTDAASLAAAAGEVVDRDRPSAVVAFHQHGRRALEGMDAGISFRSVHDPERDLTATVVSNTSRGAWPVAEVVNEFLWH